MGNAIHLLFTIYLVAVPHSIDHFIRKRFSVRLRYSGSRVSLYISLLKFGHVDQAAVKLQIKRYFISVRYFYLDLPPSIVIRPRMETGTT